MAEKSKDKYRPTKFLEENRTFFKGWDFNFYNLESDIVEDLTRAITDLGGTVSKDAKYILTDEKSVLSSTGKKHFYCVSFLSNSLIDQKIDDIEKYRISYEEETDSLSSHDNDNNKDTLDSENNRNENHKALELRTPNPYDNARIKIREKNLEPKKQKIFSVEIRESNKTKMIENKKIHSYSDELSEDSFSTSEKSNVCSVKRVNDNSNISIQTDKIPICKKPKIEASISNDESVIIVSDDESIINTNESSSSNSNLQSYSVVESVESSSMNIFDSEVLEDSEEEEEEEDDENGEINKKPLNLANWWEIHPIPENKQCKIRSCSYEPIAHEKHEWHQKNFTEFEKKILIKYVVAYDLFSQAKGIKIWVDMKKKGYLSHRTSESLRNCMRRTILPNIADFHLPAEILNKFLDLRVDRKINGHGRKPEERILESL